MFNVRDFPKLKIFATNSIPVNGDLRRAPAEYPFGPSIWAIDSRSSLLTTYLSHIGLPRHDGERIPNINQLPLRLNPDGGLLPFVRIGFSTNAAPSFLQQLVLHGAEPFAVCRVEVSPNVLFDANVFGAALLSTNSSAFDRLFVDIDPVTKMSFYQYCVRYQESRGGQVSVCPRGFASLLHVLPELGRRFRTLSAPSFSLKCANARFLPPKGWLKTSRVEWIIEHAAELNLDLNVKDRDGNAFVHLCQHESEFTALLRSGLCDCEALDGQGRNALECAITNVHAGLAAALYHRWPLTKSLPTSIFLATAKQAWIDMNSEVPSTSWKDLANSMYRSALPSARFAPIDRLDENGIRWFSQVFAEPDASVRPVPWTRLKYRNVNETLFEALLRMTMGRFQIVEGLAAMRQLLREPSLDSDCLVISKDGYTALHVFAGSDIASLVEGREAARAYDEVLQLLIKEHALDPEQADKNGITPLEAAMSKSAFKPTEKALEILLKRLMGLSPDAEDEGDHQPQQAPWGNAVLSQLPQQDDPDSDEEARMLAAAIRESLISSGSRIAPAPQSYFGQIAAHETETPLTSMDDMVGDAFMDEDEMLRRALAMSMEDVSAPHAPQSSSSNPSAAEFWRRGGQESPLDEILDDVDF